METVIVKGKRGRPAKDPNAPKIEKVVPTSDELPKAGKNVITDVCLNPYYVRLDEESYTLMKQDDVNPYGYFNKLDDLLIRVAQLKVKSINKSFALKEFINELKMALKEIRDAIPNDLTIQ